MWYVLHLCFINSHIHPYPFCTRCYIYVLLLCYIHGSTHTCNIVDTWERSACYAHGRCWSDFLEAARAEAARLLQAVLSACFLYIYIHFLVIVVSFFSWSFFKQLFLLFWNATLFETVWRSLVVFFEFFFFGWLSCFNDKLKVGMGHFLHSKWKYEGKWRFRTRYVCILLGQWRCRKATLWLLGPSTRHEW